MAEPPQRQLQSLLQAAVQAVHWTYSIFWQYCPQQGIIAWRDGYYNGAIKTRKTVQATEESAEEATLHRSQQLRELYDTLAAGDQERRPSAALSPEDLTESEWFYLMCVSFSFPPGVGLPGKAYVERQHIWLTRANKADSKLFSRAILAESAKIQTVVCIPLLDGILELGTTERVQEDIGLIQRVKSLFADSQDPNPPRPALSGHSTSNPTSSNFYSPPILPSFAPSEVAEEDEEEEEEEEEEDEIGFDSGRVETLTQPDQNPIEAMQFDMSDQDIRIGSPDDSSNNLPSNFHSSDHHGHGGFDPIINGGGLQPPHSVEVIAEEDTHYSQTVSSILEHQSNRWSKISSAAAAASATSAFSKWYPSPTCSSSSANRHNLLLDGASQWVLKYILFTTPLLHTKPRSAPSAAAAAATAADELSGNHVLAERRRREKLNERFVILRSMVPFITKMDKASILADTIEYLKQLKKRIQDLETRVRQLEAEKGSGGGREKRKTRAGDGGSARSTTTVEVSIIESEALVEISCLHKEGLVLEVMHVLGGLGLHVTTVQSSINNNAIFHAELRAKVKGRKPSIADVKRTINQIIK